MSTTTPWTELFGETLRTHDGDKPTAEVLTGKKVVGLYFSAQWCGPCRGFTPLLSATYDDMVEVHPEFEIVFISADRTPQAFTEYAAGMPFVALPYEDRDREYDLNRKFDVKGIPTLVFMNNEDEIITFDARGLVTQMNGDIEQLWHELTK